MTWRLAFYLCLLSALTVRAADATLDIYWIDVEGGGATLIVTPAKQSILIDSGWPNGPSAERIHNAATNAGLTRIDYFILTHFHADHYGGVAGLSAMMPIVNVFDNGIPSHDPDGSPDTVAFSRAITPYRKFAAEHRRTVKPGDALTLWQVNGTATLSFGFLGARTQFIHDGTIATNSFCGTGEEHAVDTSDNRNSVVSLMQFGAFKFFDGGDLTWNMEKMLVCPLNSIGPVDVYQTDHHGVDLSNNPLLVRSLAPTVSVMNNGSHKGGSLLTLKTLRSVPSIQTMYQVHKDLRGGSEYNTEDQYIANLQEDCRGNYIKCSVDPSGKSYTISIPGNGVSKTYQTRR